jgi:hypothetical protein
VIVVAIAYVLMRRRRRFNVEETARLRARARRRWSEWLDGKGPEPPHDETWVEYQERKRR